MSRRASSSAVRLLVAAGALGLLTTLGVAGFIAVFAPYKVPSSSMWPALEVGAHVLAYRWERTPERGAALVLRAPEHPEALYIKRVIGLPGDVVATKGSKLFINEWEVPHCDAGHVAYRDVAETHGGALFVEFLGDAAYLVFYDESSALGDTGSWTVGEKQAFVLGDNRNNSHDSRFWFAGVGAGVGFNGILGRLRLEANPALSNAVSASRSAIEACIAKRPIGTLPPKPSTR